VTVEFHPDADAEFAVEVDYFEAAEPGLGQRFYNEVMGGSGWVTNIEAQTPPGLLCGVNRRGP